MINAETLATLYKGQFLRKKKTDFGEISSLNSELFPFSICSPLVRLVSPSHPGLRRSRPGLRAAGTTRTPRGRGR